MADQQVQDYDCFYASVFENQNPPLKSQPVGVKQKSILATCNYIARGQGVKKLMLISEAKRLCPDLVVIDGEDLTPFRDMSKTLFSFLRSYSWNKRVERLGLDEVFMGMDDTVISHMILQTWLTNWRRHRHCGLQSTLPEQSLSVRLVLPPLTCRSRERIRMRSDSRCGLRAWRSRQGCERR